MKDLALHSLLRIGDTFSDVMLANQFGVFLSLKGPHKPEFACDIVRILSHDIHGPD